METNASAFFLRYFPLISGNRQPYPWQSALFLQFTSDRWPEVVALPTGAGKTSVIHVWLLALAWTLQTTPQPHVPRRLVWVVNRRVVVDQATDEANTILSALDRLPQDDALLAALRSASYSGVPLAVSSLRGEKADNRAWSDDPSTPAIIVGTVDMIGSRLLFRGYGDGKYYRSYHAGLLGVDSLIVNDEAHLTLAFAGLLEAIRRFAPTAGVPGKPFHTLLLSATSRAEGATPFDHSLEADLAAHDRFRAVYDAEKRLFLHPAADRKGAESEVFRLATESNVPRTVVFIEQPEAAAAFQARLARHAGADHVTLLTGTMRGFERDRLATHDPVFRAFLASETPPAPLYLVSTSAGEVGVNITSERLITPLTESDHLLQRLGRLNRFGDQPGEPHRIGYAHVVHLPVKDPDSPAAHTLRYLQALPVAPDGGRDVSCRALGAAAPPLETRQPDPVTPRLDIRLIDLWALTTTGASDVPPVAPWLHGKQDEEYPETAVAWRDDVAFLADDAVLADEVERIFEHYRVLPHERLSEPTTRVHRKLSAIAESQPWRRALFLAADGSVTAGDLAAIAGMSLEYGTVLLPPKCGSLPGGMFSSDPPDAASPPRYDVADEALPAERARARFHVVLTEGEWVWRRLPGDSEPTSGPDPRNRAELADFAAERGFRFPLLLPLPSASGEDAADYLVYFCGPAPQRKLRTEVLLQDHLDQAASAARAFAELLLPNGFADAYAAAGKGHDLGKAKPLWQRAMGGDVALPLAKTCGAVNPALLAGFRHELASLLDLGGADSALTLHLIGSHHGWARPFWKSRAYDRDRLRLSQQHALDAAVRFGVLHRRYGAWGLAYLEALFKSIDGAISKPREASR
jgi:CRISPR-associated endonuclease/helicase Cas3